MADIKISQLGIASVLTDNDVIPATASGVTVKVPASVLKEYIIGDTDISAFGDGSVTGAIDAVNDILESIYGSFAFAESSTIASRAYRVGDFVYMVGTLYRVKTPISSGDPFVVDTNIVATSIGSEIDNIILWKGTQAIASTGGSSGTLCTITDDAITTDHVLAKFAPADKEAVITAVTCTTSAGRAVITGTSTSATTAEIVLVKATKILS